MRDIEQARRPPREPRPVPGWVVAVAVGVAAVLVTVAVVLFVVRPGRRGGEASVATPATPSSPAPDPGAPRGTAGGGTAPVTPVAPSTSALPPAAPSTAPFVTLRPLVPGSTGSELPDLVPDAAVPLVAQWRATLPTTGGSVAFAPVVAGDTVIVVRERAVDALDVATGSVRWSVATSGAGAGPALVAGDAVVVAGADEVCVLGVDNGGRRWCARGEGFGPVAVGGGVVYAADRSLRAYDLATGAQQWSLVPEGSRRVVALAHDGESLYASLDIGVAAYGARGALRWWNQLSSSNAPVVVAGGLVLAGSGARVVAFDERTGDVRWSVATPLSEVRPVAVRDGRLYVTGEPGSVAALDLGSRSLLWDQPVRADGTVAAMVVGPELLAVVGDRLVVASVADNRVRGLFVPASALVPGAAVEDATVFVVEASAAGPPAVVALRVP